MILSLTINNIVLIDRLELSFDSGLTVLTGETGAGKSILLDSLGMVLGNRAEARLVRQGSDKGFVVAEFDVTDIVSISSILQQNDIEYDDRTLLVKRVVSKDGKSKAYINDVPVSLSLLQQISGQLVEIHGQHDQKGIMDLSLHKSILDSFSKNEPYLLKVKKEHACWKGALETYNKAKAIAAKSQEEEDYIRHVLKELSDFDPQASEEEDLTEQRRLLQSREKIVETIRSAKSELDGSSGVLSSLRSASRVLERGAQNIGDIFEGAVTSLDKAAYEVEEVETLLEKIIRDNNPDATSLEQVEERLFALKDLARKHNVATGELIVKKEELELQLSLIEGAEAKLSELEQEVIKHHYGYKKIASELSDRRKKSAEKMSRLVEAELKPLKMEGCQFKVEIEALSEDKWSHSGLDKVSFLIRTNVGSPFGAINKIASGGELSRFMLAMKVVLSDIRSTPTLIFDEIDTGVGGATADAVGKRLSLLAKKFQVFTVTHQPQVAAYGQAHMRVEKFQKAGSTTTRVTTLNSSEKMEEVARMLAGEVVTTEARAAAERLVGG